MDLSPVVAECAADSCHERAFSRGAYAGWCLRHGYRVKKYGDAKRVAIDHNCGCMPCAAARGLWGRAWPDVLSEIFDNRSSRLLSTLDQRNADDAILLRVWKEHLPTLRRSGATKARCKRGHKLSSGNVIMLDGKRRGCRQCSRIRAREQRQRLKRDPESMERKRAQGRLYMRDNSERTSMRMRNQRRKRRKLLGLSSRGQNRASAPRSARPRQAYEMWLAGASSSEIAAALGYRRANAALAAARNMAAWYEAHPRLKPTKKETLKRGRELRAAAIYLQRYIPRPTTDVLTLATCES